MNRDRCYYSFVTNDVKWAIIATVFCFVTVWFMWIFYIARIIYYKNTTMIILKTITAVKEVYYTTRGGDSGYRYAETVQFTAFPATNDDFKKNNRKAIFFIILLIVNLFMLYIIFEDITYA